MLFLPVALLAGCASPGQPKPPSLHLPQPVEDLSAVRVGAQVHLRWTTPSLTTDDLPVLSHLSAVICRQAEPAASGRKPPCLPIHQGAVQPGPSEAVDTLPADLSSTGSPAGLLSYRVEIFNSAGRSAGRSPEALALSGGAPPAVAELAATPIRNGIRLTWIAAAGAEVELHRIEPSSAPAPARKRHGPELSGDTRPRQSSDVHLIASDAGRPDPGGTIDRSVEKGATYRYTAQRVQTSVVAGHTLTVRSEVSAPVTVTVLDTFPPQPPSGLDVAVSGGNPGGVDLSWRPGAEADLAGYNIYRLERETGAGASASWRRVNTALVPVPAYTDPTARPGTAYSYRVTAVDNTGNESAPGPDVQITP